MLLKQNKWRGPTIHINDREILICREKIHATHINFIKRIKEALKSWRNVSVKKTDAETAWEETDAETHPYP